MRALPFPETDTSDIAVAPLKRSRMFKIKSIRIFEAGTHKGEVYTTEDIDSMVSNFKAYSQRFNGQSPLLEVPAVLGHDKVQILLKITGLPSSGWFSDVWAAWDTVEVPMLDDDGQPILDDAGNPQTEPHEGYFLFAEVSEIPEEAAQWIIDGQYRYVSVELSKRDVAPPGLQVPKFCGFALQRVAFLGGSNPYVKTLGEIPTPELDLSPEMQSAFSGFDPTHSNLVCFSLPPAGTLGGMNCYSEDDEEPPMNEQLKQSLMAQGIPEQAADEMAKLDPGTYASVSKCYADIGAGTGAANFDRAGAIEKLGGLPNADRTALAAMSDDELKALMSKNGFASDPNPAPDAQPNTPKDPPYAGNSTNNSANHAAGGKKFADDPAKKDEDDKKFSASILQGQRRLEQEMSEFKAWRRDQDRKATAKAKLDQDKHQALLCEQADGFCAQLIQDRKALPGEAEAYKKRLKLLAKNQAPDEVVTFSADGTEKKGSPFDALMAELKNLPKIPARFFSADGIAAGGNSLTDAEKARPVRVNRMLGSFEEGRIALANKKAKAATN